MPGNGWEIQAYQRATESTACQPMPGSSMALGEGRPDDFELSGATG